MKKFIIFFLLLSPAYLISQDEAPDYLMWESMYITPDYSDLEGFSAAMTHHNKTYHKEGPYAANVYNVVTGPNSGKVLWIMGPCTYSDLDNRPSADGHDENWANNVMSKMKKMHQGEYWTMNTDLSTIAPGSGPYKIFRVRYHEVNRGEGHRANEWFKRISDTLKSMEGDNPWGLFHNEWQQGYKIGRHFATVSYHNSWSELDEDRDFQAAFTALHGQNSWTQFLNDNESIFSNSWDEFWVHVPEMSGPE